MLSLRTSTLILMALAAICLGPARLAAQNGDKSAAEAVVRAYEHACEQYDFEKANSLLAPGARWIEDSYPGPAEFNGTGWSKHWEEMKAAKVRINYQVRDMDVRVRGDVAWATLTLDTVMTADTKAAMALNDNLAEWRGVFVESYVLEKTDNGWRVALGHTSLLPKKTAANANK